MKIQVSEATGKILAYLVARVKGIDIVPLNYYKDHVGFYINDYDDYDDYGYGEPVYYEPHENWAQGGPIIQKERINLTTGLTIFDWWAVQDSSAGYKANGGTPLVAAMRCYVASHLGNEADVPDGIME